MMMIVNGIKTEIIQFETLCEFLKPNTAHYILKYSLDYDKAVYYTVADGINYVLLAFCIDKNFNCERLKVERNKVMSADIETVNTIVIAEVWKDSFLDAVLKTLDEPEEKKKK